MTEGVAIEYELNLSSVGQSTDFTWFAVVKARWADNHWPLAFYVIARTDAEDRSEKAAEEWGQRLLAAAADCPRLSAFKENDLTYRIRTPIENRGNRFSAIVSGEQLRQFEEELSVVEKAKADFNDAVTHLRHFAESPPHHGYSGNEEQMYSYLDRCLFQSGYLGHLTQWYREKMSTIRRSINDLARRKDRSHRGYQFSQNQMRQALVMFETPAAWIDRPQLLTR